MCHYFLGLVLSLSPLAGYYAFQCSTTGIFELLSLSFFTLFWVGGFDILYALQDYNFDTKNKIFSIPANFGKRKAILISFISFMSAIFALCLYQVSVFDRTFIGQLVILVILLNFIAQIYFSNKGNFDFFKYNSYVGFLILLLTISDIFNI
jgi:4-hydroxybenzoate polyprenyltransferase